MRATDSLLEQVADLQQMLEGLGKNVEMTTTGKKRRGGGSGVDDEGTSVKSGIGPKHPPINFTDPNFSQFTETPQKSTDPFNMTEESFKSAGQIQSRIHKIIYSQLFQHNTKTKEKIDRYADEYWRRRGIDPRVRKGQEAYAGVGSGLREASKSYGVTEEFVSRFDGSNGHEEEDDEALQV